MINTVPRLLTRLVRTLVATMMTTTLHVSEVSAIELVEASTTHNGFVSYNCTILYVMARENVTGGSYGGVFSVPSQDVRHLVV